MRHQPSQRESRGIVSWKRKNIVPEIIMPEEGEKLSSAISDFIVIYAQKSEAVSNEE